MALVKLKATSLGLVLLSRRFPSSQIGSAPSCKFVRNSMSFVDLSYHSPIPLLWNVQIDFRVKISIIALLGLGIFASTAAIVRLTVTVNLSATTDFLYYAMPVAAWAHAELGLGVVLANLSALRPLLEKVLDIGSALRSGSKKRTGDQASGDRYMELEEGVRNRKSATLSKRLSVMKGNGATSRGEEDLDGNSSLGEDDRSTRNIMSTDGRPNAHSIQVDHEYEVSYESGKGS